MGLYSLLAKKKREQKRKEVIKLAKIAAISAAVGTVAGSTAGVLLAPKSGKATISDIVAKTAEAKNVLVKTKNNVNSKLEEGKSSILEAKAKIAEYLANKVNSSTTEED